MDIGTLTGQIAIEDQLSDHLTEIANHVREFATDFDGALGAIAVSVGIVTAAVVGMTISIVELGQHGSTILGVENAFDHLAESAGTTGDALRESLSEGVKHTVDDFDLMTATSKLLASGMKLSSDQALLMSSAARELGKATGTDAAGGLNIMSGALLTGRVRGLQQQIGLIDLAAGEKKFADSIGATVDQLNEAGKLEGKRIAILDATKAYVDRLGVSELSFKERIQQAETAIDEWKDTLEKSIAGSPHVSAAMDAISKAIQSAFGTTGQSALENILQLVNSFADGVATYAPVVIGWVGKVKDAFSDLFGFLSDHAELIKNLAIGVTAYAGAWAVLQIGGSVITGVIAGLKAIQVAAAALEAGSLLTLITPIGLVAAAVAGLALAVYNFNKSMSDLENQGKTTGKAIEGLKDSTGHAVLSIDDVTDKTTGLGKPLDVVNGLTVQLKTNTDASTAALDKSAFTTGKLTEAQKQYAEALANVLSFQQTWQDRFNNLSDDVVQGTKYFLEHGAAAGDLAKMYGVTKSDIEAVQQQMKFQESTTTATTKAFTTQTGYIATAVVPTYSEFHEQLTGVDDTTGDLASTMINSGTATFSFADAAKYAATQTDALQKILKNTGTSLSQGLMKDLQDIPKTLASAFTGGGGFIGGIEAVGTKIGATIGQHLGDDLGKVMTGAGGFIAKLGSFAGPIGSALGSLVGPIVDFFSNIGGPSKDELAARDKFKDLQLSGESLNDTIGRVSASLIAAGKTGPEALAMIQRALDATHTNAASVASAIDDINSVINTAAKDQQDLTDAVQRYNFSLAELGPTMQKQQLDAQAQQLLNDWRLLVGSGIQVATVNEHMTDSMEAYLKSAKTTGQEVPAAMEPILQQMIDQGLLLDDNGDKITDLKDLGVSFSESMTQGFQSIVDKLDILLQGLGLIPKAIDAIPDSKTISIDTIYPGGTPPWNEQYDPNSYNPYGSVGGMVTGHGIQYFGGGGKVLPFSPRGTDTVPAMLSPGEMVLTPQQQQDRFSTEALEAKFDKLQDTLLSESRRTPERLAIAITGALAKAR